MFEPRTYRSLVSTGRLTSFAVVVKETDLLVHAALDLREAARELVLEHRGYLEAYIRQYPEFLRTLAPWPLAGPWPAVVGEMVAAGATPGDDRSAASETVAAFEAAGATWWQEIVSDWLGGLDAMRARVEAGPPLP